MNTKIRKFEAAGEACGEFIDVDHRAEECAFCECARTHGIKFREDHTEQDEAVVFLENEAGVVHRISARKIDGVVVLSGKDVTQEAARAEIRAKS